jgi:hypothetical protein
MNTLVLILHNTMGYIRDIGGLMIISSPLFILLSICLYSADKIIKKSYFLKERCILFSVSFLLFGCGEFLFVLERFFAYIYECWKFGLFDAKIFLNQDSVREFYVVSMIFLTICIIAKCFLNENTAKKMVIFAIIFNISSMILMIFLMSCATVQ